MALELKDIQREGMMADIIMERNNMIISQAQVIQSKDAQIKILEARVAEFIARFNKDAIKE